jgi:2-polyprenyl-3-methyl-5-hydroxy-6-metoxy-1,4-benzoquinol methylase
MISNKNKIYQNSGNEDVINLITGDGPLVLDVGCGTGSIAKILTSQAKIVDGISISEDELHHANRFLRNSYLFNLEEGLPPAIGEESFDYVICSHVLEHVAYPEKLLRDIQKVLKPTGSLVVALPNLFHYKSRMQLLRGNFPRSEAGIWDETHLRWYTFRSASEMLSEYFEIETATVTGDLPFNSVARKILPIKMSESLYKILTGISKGFFGYQLLYRCIKRQSNP